MFWIFRLLNHGSGAFGPTVGWAQPTPIRYELRSVMASPKSVHAGVSFQHPPLTSLKMWVASNVPVHQIERLTSLAK